MHDYRPHLLPKVRSEYLMDWIGGKRDGLLLNQPYPCTLRIATLVPGKTCAARDTVVGCHTGNLGKGMSTKVSDIDVAAGCFVCHDLLDRRNEWYDFLLNERTGPFYQRILNGLAETRALLVQDGILKVKRSTII